MKVKQISSNQSFEGKVIVKNPISVQQNYLFGLHKPALEKMIADLPFDLFVEQSKSKKTITLSTNVEGAESFFVRKNEQNFEEVAGRVISDSKNKSELYKKMVKSAEILDYLKLNMINIMFGQFKEARKTQKEIAKLAVKDFEIYKNMTNFRLINLPPEANKMLFKNIIKYRLYSAFSKKTPEEKQLYKMNKEYLKEMKAQNKKIKPVIIDFMKIYNAWA